MKGKCTKSLQCSATVSVSAQDRRRIFCQPLHSENSRQKIIDFRRALLDSALQLTSWLLALSMRPCCPWRTRKMPSDGLWPFLESLASFLSPVPLWVATFCLLYNSVPKLIVLRCSLFGVARTLLEPIWHFCILDTLKLNSTSFLWNFFREARLWPQQLAKFAKDASVGPHQRVIPWSSLVEGDEQTDWPKSQTGM